MKIRHDTMAMTERYLPAIEWSIIICLFYAKFLQEFNLILDLKVCDK